MKKKVVVLVLVLLSLSLSNGLNLAPVFTNNMNQHTIKENTPVGSIIYTLSGQDPEGSRVRYGLSGTDLLSADPITGAVTVVQEIDREAVEGNDVRLLVSIADEPQESGQPPNVVTVPISVIILDENDNLPQFQGLPYKATIREDIPVESTLFQAIEVTDKDLVGDVLDVQCVPRQGFEEGVCDSFEIVPRRLETDHDMFRGSVVLKKPLDYRLKQLYRLPIVVKDGRFEVESEIVFSVLDVQNTPPMFMGSLTGIVSEDDPVGTNVLTVKARDGDTGQARRIIYTLEENPNNYFAIDNNNGVISIDKPIDRETLGASSGGVLMLRVRASELVNGVPREDDESTTSTADITITIRDVNDEPPLFNQNEYKVSLLENVPFGTPLANLNMEVKDLDTAPNAIFDINLVGGDPNGKFAVEPKRATGHSAVSLKVNSQNLDYENANERKFLLLVEAKEANVNGRRGLSSTATVTVEVLDLNDNSPIFPTDSYTADVSEAAPEGYEVITIAAEDRDSGDFGTQGIRYQLNGQGSHLFNVDPLTGKITVASCIENCLDYESIRAYYLSFSATDNNGEGKKTVVNLRISVADANDNAPTFNQRVYKASIDEGEAKFEPQLFVKATDLDESSILRFNIIDGNTNNLFNLNRLTGEISVRQRSGLRLDNIPTDMIRLSVEVSDGENTDSARVEINVKDVNDRVPIFEKRVYLSSVPEIASIGTEVEYVHATDADFGINAQIKYKISTGAYDDFAIDGETGVVTLNGDLDYDRKDSYSIEILAVDGGTPALTGTATLTVSIMNKNNKEPYFSPSTQRAQITENTPVGTLVIVLNGTDPDAENGRDNLRFDIDEPITAVDKDGARVNGDLDTRYKNFFEINSTTGEVFVAEELDRSVAAIVSMTVSLTDLSADPVQVGKGNLIITIVDVNDFPPAFIEPWSPQSPFLNIVIPEEQASGTIVHTFRASDADSNIDSFAIISPSRSKRPYDIDAATGDLIITDRIDFEALDNKQLTFDLAVYDAGVPQKSAMASIAVKVENLNDESPVFKQSIYSVALPENSPIGSEVIQVEAIDADEGEFGQVSYELNHPAFSIDPDSGIISVINSQLLDREDNPEIILQVSARDQAPNSRSTSVPVNITILDINDNAPRFIKKVYAATIVDNIPYYPEPSPIIQLLAEDADIGKNAELYFYIISGNDQGQFFIDNAKGIIYPNTSFVGQNGAIYELTVQVYDEAGEVQAWEDPDRAIIAISVENVNTHKPEWFPDPPPNETVELMEEEDVNYIILKVNARDNDRNSDNGRVSYHFKVNNENVGETEEFAIDAETGEVRAKIIFDREFKDTYELVLVARDHGTPVSFETLRFVTIKIKDINDHDPAFDIKKSSEDIRFTVPEEEEPGYLVGKVEAIDPDEGKNGRVFYYIIDGNEDKWFSIDKTYGNIYTKQKLDREERDHYMIQVKTTNNPDLVCEGSVCDIEPVADPRGDDSVIMVHIFVEDKNDNLPQFESDEFFIGIPFDAKIGDLILDAQAYDPDVPNEIIDESYANKITYSIRTSNLYRSGSTTSSGSLVPSPFEMQQNGRLVLASLVAEFTQDKFVIEIEAKESLTQHRTRATVNLWVYEPSQLIKLIVEMPPMQVNKDKKSIIKALKNVTQDIVVLDDIRYHISPKDGLRRDMTDMYVHVVNEADNTIIEPTEVVNVVDANYDTLAKVYVDAGIQKIIPSASSKDTVGFAERLDPNLAALIALLISLFIGAILFAILCCCIKNWAFASAMTKASAKSTQKMPPASPGLSRPMSAMAGGAGIYNNPTSLIDSPDGGPVSGTENPLWIDQKYKAYEEQELTMTVFSDQENSVISGQAPGNGNGASRPGSISRASAFTGMETNSNAYATINKLPLVATASRRRSLLGLVNNSMDNMDRDYATLEKMSPRSPPGPIVPGVHSSTPLGGIARRFSNDFAASTGSRANLIINQNGEPELVADLM